MMKIVFPVWLMTYDRRPAGFSAIHVRAWLDSSIYVFADRSKQRGTAIVPR